MYIPVQCLLPHATEPGFTLTLRASIVIPFSFFFLTLPVFLL